MARDCCLPCVRRPSLTRVLPLPPCAASMTPCAPSLLTTGVSAASRDLPTRADFQAQGVARSAADTENARTRDLTVSAVCLCAVPILRPVFAELTYNLESFNPAFTSCLLMVRGTAHIAMHTHTAQTSRLRPLALRLWYVCICVFVCVCVCVVFSTGPAHHWSHRLRAS